MNKGCAKQDLKTVDCKPGITVLKPIIYEEISGFIKQRIALAPKTIRV